MPQNPWEMDWSAPSGGAAPATDPIIKPRDRYKEEDQGFQRSAEARANEAARRAADADARAAAAAARSEAEWNAKHNPDGSEKPAADTKQQAYSQSAMDAFDRAIGSIDQLKAHPGLGAAVGSGFDPAAWGSYNPVNGKPFGGTRAAGFDARLNTLKAQVFLPMVQSMKGMGALSNAEGEKLTAAIGALDPAMPEDEFLASLEMVKKDLNTYRSRAAGQPGAPTAPSAEQRDPNAAYDDQGNVAGLAGSVTDDTPRPGDPPPVAPPPSDGRVDGSSSWTDQLKAGIGDVVQGVGDIGGIISNPLNATINAATGLNLSTDMGETLRTDVFGLPHGNRTIEMINRGGVGALTGSVLARGAAVASNPGVMQNALRTFSATPGRDMLAGAGAGAGGEIGKQVGGTPGQVIGTLAGGALGYGGGNALLRTGTPRTPSPLLQKADDLGVTMMPADVGGTGTRLASGATRMTLGGIPMAEGATKAVNSAAAARTRIASDIGSAADNVGAGQAVKRGFTQFTRSSEKRGGELFEKVSVPAESSVQLGQTRGALEEVTRGMQSNPELSRLWANHPRLRATLEALTPKDVAADGRTAFSEASDRMTNLQDQYEAARNAVTDPKDLLSLRQQIEKARGDLTAAKELIDTPPQGGELSWQDMKRFRSIVGEVIGQPGIQRDGSDIAALRKLYGAVTSDMEVSAAQAGPKALQEFRRANQYWRGRESRIDDVFSTLLGKDGNRSDEGVFKQINTWAKGENGDFGRIARTIRSMPDDEANTVRSTIIQRMGMAKPANQDAAGEVFSPAMFSTEWRALSSRAKNVLFPNKQHRDDLEKLAELTDGMKKADEYRNYSNTSLGVNATGQGAFAIANLPAAAALAGLQFGAGKLLASPRFARIIASSSKLPAEQQGRRITEQLGILATREPLVRADAKALQQYLQQTLGESPMRAAAEEKSDRRRPPPQQR